MPSRKPPSQRDPLARLSQAVRAGSPASMGGRVANAAPVNAAGTGSRRTVAAPAAGPVVLPVLHGDPATLVEGLLWFDLDASC